MKTFLVMLVVLLIGCGSPKISEEFTTMKYLDSRVLADGQHAVGFVIPESNCVNVLICSPSQYEVFRDLKFGDMGQFQYDDLAGTNIKIIDDSFVWFLGNVSGLTWVPEN